MTKDLLSIPKNAGRAIVNEGAVIACPLLGTDKFVKFCKERGLAIDRKRLLRLERLGFFAPVFRVRTPKKDVRHLSIPPAKENDWFTKRWAWDTTGINKPHKIPDPNDRTQEGYYSIFQIDHLALVLSGVTLTVQMDRYLEGPEADLPDWDRHGSYWLQHFREDAVNLREHEFRRALALICQFISDRYYPSTQGNQRTIQTRRGFYSDSWVSVLAPDWDWYEVVRTWDPHRVERLFKLTPKKLEHSFRAVAVAQSSSDPLRRWYQLIQFVSVRMRRELKGDALRAETLRASAHMLRLLYQELYGNALPHPNEVTGTVITHVPELEVRKDTRRYLELVVNRFDLNPQPKLCLMVEGPSEEIVVTKIFEQYFGAHHGTYSIEIVVLGGVDSATGGKQDRYRAILRLIDYLHHHQTITFLILDNENYVRKLQRQARKMKSIHHKRRFVTRPDYLKIWRTSFEFENFSCTEITKAITEMAPAGVTFSSREVIACKASRNAAACLNALFKGKVGKGLQKKKLSQLLAEQIFSPDSRRKIENRPIVRTLERVARLASLNPLQTMQESWEVNQASKYLGKKRAITE